MNSDKRNQFYRINQELLKCFMLAGLILKMCLFHIFQMDLVDDPSILTS